VVASGVVLLSIIPIKMVDEASPVTAVVCVVSSSVVLSTSVD